MPFIVFEGIDACGKSTQIKRLASFLSKRSIAHVLTREPGGTKLGHDIRALLLRTQGESPVPRAELLLYEADRAQHVEKVILPALRQKRWVISDRFAASTLAFQAHGRSLKPKDIEKLSAYATNNLEPDLTVLLDISVLESQRRMGKRVLHTGIKKDRFELEKLEFHKRVRKSYLKQAKSRAKKWLVVDGTLPEDTITETIKQELCLRKWIRK